jgi:hypothetical protein
MRLLALRTATEASYSGNSDALFAGRISKRIQRKKKVQYDVEMTTLISTGPAASRTSYIIQYRVWICTVEQ